MRVARVRAPAARACASFPSATAPCGSRIAAAIPARAAYAAAEAAVLPVEAQTTARAPCASARETATVMPRSLNEPVGLALSSLSQRSRPSSCESVSAWTSGVEPSPSETTRSPCSRGSRSR